MDLHWIAIPAGTLRMGAQSSDAAAPGHDPDATDREGPVHEVTLCAFEVLRDPVSVAQYSAFLAAATAPAPPKNFESQLASPDRPVTGISWHDADMWCSWAGGFLPTEAQWEWVARGPEGRRWPWGEDYPGPQRLNCWESNRGGPSPMGSYPDGATPEGVRDLAGNVWEWCADPFLDYDVPVAAGSGLRGNREDEGPRAIRGGCYAGRATFARGAMRSNARPAAAWKFRGFRAARLMADAR